MLQPNLPGCELVFVDMLHPSVSCVPSSLLVQDLCTSKLLQWQAAAAMIGAMRLWSTEGPPRVELQKPPRTTEEPPRKVRKTRLPQRSKMEMLQSVVGIKGSSLSSVLKVVNAMAGDGHQVSANQLRQVTRELFNQVRRQLALLLATGCEVSDRAQGAMQTRKTDLP